MLPPEQTLDSSDQVFGQAENLFGQDKDGFDLQEEVPDPGKDGDYAPGDSEGSAMLNMAPGIVPDC